MSLLYLNGITSNFKNKNVNFKKITAKSIQILFHCSVCINKESVKYVVIVTNLKLKDRDEGRHEGKSLKSLKKVCESGKKPPKWAENK